MRLHLPHRGDGGGESGVRGNRLFGLWQKMLRNSSGAGLMMMALMVAAPLNVGGQADIRVSQQQVALAVQSAPAAMSQVAVANTTFAFKNQELVDQALSYPDGIFSAEPSLQCRPFVVNKVLDVVRARHNLKPLKGYGDPDGCYYGDYLHHGGVLVDINSAAPGDIIQMIPKGHKTENSTMPTAGLHTVIVISVTSPGHYRVRECIYGKVGNSDWSQADWSASDIYIWRFGDPSNSPPTIPAVPTNLRVNRTANSAVLSWTDASDNEAGFHVRYKVGQTSNWVTASTTIAAGILTYTVGDLDAKTHYVFQVRAHNAAGNSDWSEYGYGPAPTTTTTQAATKPTIPAVPTNLRVNRTANSAVLSWTDASDNEAGFHVRYKVGQTSNWVTASTTIAAGILTYTVGDLDAKTHYVFQVRAHNAAGNSDWSEYGYGPAPTTTTTQAAPTTPTPTLTPNPSGVGRILRNVDDDACYLITVDGKRAWIPTGGDYQAIVNNGIKSINTYWSNISVYPDAGYHAIVRRQDDPAIGGDPKWIVHHSGDGHGNDNDYDATKSAFGRSYYVNWAVWTLANGRGKVKLNAYIPSMSDIWAGVVYEIWDGGTRLASVPVNQFNYKGWMNLGTWTFTSGTIVVKCFDNQGTGPYDVYMGWDCIEAVPIG